MFRRRGLVVALVACLTGLLALASTAQAAPVVVEVAPGTAPTTVAKRHGITPEHVYTETVIGFSADVTAAQRAALDQDRSVEVVSDDEVIARIEPPRFRVTATPGSGVATPQFDQPPQFISDEIRRVRATLSRTADIDGIDDRRVDADIAVLDGGVDATHPDLNVVGGVNCAPGRGFDDRSGHGTFVAGQAAAIDNAIGVVGTAPGARIWAVRVFAPDGSGTDSSLLCGLDWVVRNSARIDVANLSLGEFGNVVGPCLNPRRLIKNLFGKRKRIDRFHQQICRATERGVTVVSSAGNDSADASTYTPAAYPEVIAVSAIGDFDGLRGGLAPTPATCDTPALDDQFAYFSNFGSPIDIAAPGICNISTFPGGLYAVGDGTSFSTPLVAGAAALLKARNPSLSPAKIRSRLLAKAEPGPIPGDPDSFPEGVLDASTL